MRPLLYIFALFISLPTFGKASTPALGKTACSTKTSFGRITSWLILLPTFIRGGKIWANLRPRSAENSLSDIEQKLEFKNGSKVELMVYTTLSDLKQTNIGASLEENNTGGVTKIVGNKVFVYFDGDYQKFATQIRQGIGRVSLERMVFGTTIQEVLQNALLLNLPDWYVNGLVAYIGEEWNTTLDNQLRQAMLDDQFRRFNRLTADQATLAGHAFWHYIELTNGASAIPNLLYLTRVNRSIESAFMFVLGTSVEETIEQFNNYYKTLYQSETAKRIALNSDSLLTKPMVRYTDDRPKKVGRVRLSPNGEWIAYTTTEMGKQEIWLYNTQTHDQKRLVRNAFKSYKHPYMENYPLLAWDKNSEQLAMAYERRDETVMQVYNTQTEERVENPNIVKFQQVTDMDFTTTQQMVVSGMQNSQVDLFLYDLPNTKVTRLTNDFYADLQPRYVELAGGRRGIVFLSNRQTDTLRFAKLDKEMPLGNYDVFFYDLRQIVPIEENSTYQIVQLTDTPLSNESRPMRYDSLHITYLAMPTESTTNMWRTSTVCLCERM